MNLFRLTNKPHRLIISLLLIASCSLQLANGTNKQLSKNEFIAMASGSTKTESKTLWLNEKLQAKISAILDHPYPKLRLRYLRTNDKKQTLWFLNEIGKERPISFAVSVIDKRISLMKVLVFRESRGGEIRMQSFSDQFNQLGLKDNSKLDQTIDGISGATMSVTAMKKIARLALMLDAEVNQ